MMIPKLFIQRTIISFIDFFNLSKGWSNEMSEVKYEFFLSDTLLPGDFKYPQSYIDFVKREIPDTEPWHFLCNELEWRFKGLKQRYPNRSVIPFARRRDNDDVACFDGADTSGNPRVFIIHDFASPGWEGRGEYENFNEWLKLAKDESEEWKQSQ